MLLDDIRFLNVKKRLKKGLMENLRKHRKKIRLIWNKFARAFLFRYSKKKKQKTKIVFTKDFHYHKKTFGKVLGSKTRSPITSPNDLNFQK